MVIIRSTNIGIIKDNTKPAKPNLFVNTISNINVKQVMNIVKTVRTMLLTRNFELHFLQTIVPPKPNRINLIVLNLYSLQIKHFLFIIS
ncbi:hypothetical protein MNBD_GAMMA01-2005 [hydrothermal vent metagenome]|uniref:Uncharacterized protein n=1 Tax=hydrothermal vent metagenome TaxID=652676 RepID=A0A3B0V2A0_9ZZZZ